MPAPTPRSRRRRLTLALLFTPAGIGMFVLASDRHRADALEAPPGPAVEPMRFRSGVTVLVASQPAMPSFTATIHYKVGQANEWQGLWGAAELLGRMLLDGTGNIGTRDPGLEATLLAKLDALDGPLQRKRQALAVMDPAQAAPVRAELEALTARHDALVKALTANSSDRIYGRLYRERGGAGPFVRVTPIEVQYTVTLPNDQLSYFMALEAARLADFSSRGFYAARDGIAGERRQEVAQPGLSLLRGLFANAYQVHPFGRYQADAGSLEGIDRAELELFRRAWFRPVNTVIAFAGGVRSADVRALADRYLSGLAPGYSPGLIEAVEPPQQGGRRIEVEGEGGIEVLMAFRGDAAGLRAGDPLLPVLLELVGDPADGMLGELVHGGLATRVVATGYPPAPPVGSLYPGLLVVGASAAGASSPTRLEAELWKGLQGLAHDGPSAEALEGAKERARARLARLMGEPAELAPALARAFATLEDETALNQLYRKIGEVGIDQVRNAAAKLFEERNRTVAVLRPASTAVAANAHGKADPGTEKASHDEPGHGEKDVAAGAGHGEKDAAAGAGHGEKDAAAEAGHGEKDVAAEAGHGEKGAEGKESEHKAAAPADGGHEEAPRGSSDGHGAGEKPAGEGH